MFTSAVGIGRQLQADDEDIRNLVDEFSEMVLTGSILGCFRTDAKIISAGAG